MRLMSRNPAVFETSTPTNGAATSVIIVIIIVMVTVNTTLSYFALNYSTPNAQTCPGVRCVPIIITDSQSVPVGSGTQLAVTVDWSSYGSVLSSNLQNVQFLDSGYRAIPAWLESCDGSYSSCSSSSRSSLVWVKLDESIQGGGHATIYLSFYSTSINEFSSIGSWGESPLLSPTYGSLDNGASVFAFYDNFAGSTLSSLWVNNSAQSENTLTINNGITVQPARNANNLPAVSSVKTFSQGITEFYGAIPTGGQTGYFTAATFGLHGTTGWDSDVGVVEGSYGLVGVSSSNSPNAFGTVPGLSFGADNVYSLIIPSAASSVRMAEVNYGSMISGTSNSPSLPQPIGLQNQENTGIALGPIYWIRERTYVPEGVLVQAG